MFRRGSGLWFSGKVNNPTSLFGSRYLLVQQKVEVFEIKRSASSKLFDYNLVLKRWNSKKITWSWFEVWFLGIGMLWHSFARVEDFKFLYYFIVPDLDFFLNVNVFILKICKLGFYVNKPTGPRCPATKIKSMETTVTKIKFSLLSSWRGEGGGGEKVQICVRSFMNNP